MAEDLRFWIEAGGPIVLVLAGVSMVSVALIAVKLIQLAPATAGRRGRAAALKAWADGDAAGALARVVAGRSPADRVAALAMRGMAEGRDAAVLQAEVEAAAAFELDALGSHIRALEIIAMVSPLLGLLGTVLGMIDAFRSLELAQGAANASVLAGGVWTALLTTAMGLIAAIPAAVAAGLFAARVDRAGREIETTVAALVAAERRRAA